MDKPATSKEALHVANLDWEVIKAPLFCTYDNKINSLKDKYATIKKDWVGKDKPHYGIITKGYEIIQNIEAFDWFDSIVGEGKAIFHAAGALFAGQIVWIAVKFPTQIVLSGNDKLISICCLPIVMMVPVPSEYTLRLSG